MSLRGLYAITPACADSAALLDRATQALIGGVAMLQYRSKQTDAARRRHEARALAALCKTHGTPFIVNDDVALALEVNADGVHLGRDDGDVAAARARLPGGIIGVSCYDQLTLAHTACAQGADYVAFGSVFASPTKPGAVRAPLTLFAAAKPLGVPRAAIGGITLDNAPSAIAAGADLLAVISDLFDAPDIGARARAYATLFDARSQTAS
ncbi:MAG: thiamine phosphate synthase [Proteobacteria bacterium]|nr:thiamine phosphate synthase [Pseudomonadota bacterium]